jgi:pimeloyl-ACP methyl ester carboxylesterase
LTKNFRKYGEGNYKTAVVHGGPGAAGEMAPVAIELSCGIGVLEPLQTAFSVEGQIEELNTVLREQGEIPFTIIGYSWGAWLSFLTAARYPEVVSKLILVSSPPFEEKFVPMILERRLNHLNEPERKETRNLMLLLSSGNPGDNDLARFGELMAKADAFDLITHKEVIEYRGDSYKNVWNEAAGFRRSGGLLSAAKQIRCPVISIHGDYDPHPAEGVKEPLSGILKNFKFILLKNCGHTPWLEKQARNRFFELLRKELS